MLRLKNKRIVITRPRHQVANLAKLLQGHGAIPVLFPSIKISPVFDSQLLDKALQNIAYYDWLILTSVNGVEAVWNRLAFLGIDQIPAHVQVAAIGPRTAQALLQRGCQVDYTPSQYRLEEILPGLGYIKGKKILLARADLARSVLPEMIRSNGGLADDITAYHTLPVKPDPDGIEAIKAGVDLVTFTSPSIVENFVGLIESIQLSILTLPGQPAFAYIGPITAEKARAFGMPQNIIAEEFTTEGLVEVILAYYQREEVKLA
jgi:uroporphyrinogen III methyltransferase/synthase